MLRVGAETEQGLDESWIASSRRPDQSVVAEGVGGVEIGPGPGEALHQLEDPGDREDAISAHGNAGTRILGVGSVPQGLGQALGIAFGNGLVQAFSGGCLALLEPLLRGFGGLDSGITVTSQSRQTSGQGCPVHKAVRASPGGWLGDPRRRWSLRIWRCRPGV